jgi:hypothetical protein
MKQTAVEWLVDYFSKYVDMNKHIEEIEQAKEMEKKQISEAYEDGYSDSDNSFELNKEYYNKKFNK